MSRKDLVTGVVDVGHGASAARRCRPPRRRPGGARLVPRRDPRGAAAVLDRLHRPRRRLVAARVQPRAGDPAALLLHVPARDARGAAGDRPGHRPPARRRRRGPRPLDRGARQPRADRRHRLLRDDRLDRRPRAHAVRHPPRLLLLALGAAPRLHAAAAAVPLLAAQHRAAVRLLRDRGLLRRAHGGAGLPRRQHHRPRGLQAAGGRGLLGPALPVPDHELHLRLRGALPRPALAQGGAARSRRCRSRS